MRQKIDDRASALQKAVWRLAADHITAASTEAERDEAERDVCSVLGFLAAGAYVLHTKGDPCPVRWTVNSAEHLADAVDQYPEALASGLF